MYLSRLVCFVSLLLVDREEWAEWRNLSLGSKLAFRNLMANAPLGAVPWWGVLDFLVPRPPGATLQSGAVFFLKNVLSLCVCVSVIVLENVGWDI